MIIGSKALSDGANGAAAKGTAAAGAARAPSGAGGPLVVGAERVALEEERDFLLASLRDLEAEHGAGDIGELDYHTLRDDYTVRAAAVLRALEAERSPRRPESAVSRRLTPADRSGPSDVGPIGGRGGRRRRWRTALVAAGVLLVAVVAAWAVTASSGSRLASQPITGSLAGKSAPGATTPATTGVDPRLTQAAQLVQKGKITDALKLYDQVLKDRPHDPQALASEGWLIAQAGVSGKQSALVDQGLAKIEAAEKADANYPTAHFFRGFLLYQAKGDPAGGVTEFRLYLGLVDPSSPDVPTVEQYLNAALAAAGTNVAPGPNAPSPAAGPSTTAPSTTSPPSTLAGPPG